MSILMNCSDGCEFVTVDQCGGQRRDHDEVGRQESAEFRARMEMSRTGWMTCIGRIEDA